MLGRAITFALVGLEPRRVEVEAHLRTGQQPSFSIVGLADRACQEAKHRVRSGVHSSLLEWPEQVITVNLAPAALRKEGTGFDVAIALTVLAASGQVPPDRLAEHACIGELGLDGRDPRPSRGRSRPPRARRARGSPRLLCSADSAREAALAGIEAVGVRHIAEAVGYLRGEDEIVRRVADDGSALAARPPRPRGRPRPGAGPAGARARRGRGAQPPPRRSARDGQDDARAAAAVDPPAADAARRRSR